MNEKPVEILIVDDDPQMLKYVSMILEKEGYDVMTADNGKAALESAIKEKPDLVLSDILMPVMDGFQLCREIRLDRRVQFTPVILYSASYVDKEDEQLGKDVGADSYLRKPLEREKLLATIDGLVSRRSSVSISQASEEEIFYQKYNETLVQKLENRTVQLETENQKLKETLQDSKRSSEWYREVFDGINVAAVVFDATTRECVEVNRSALHLYGYTRKEF
ncbi:MAG: response regulator, partial [Fidelibacterota bacterium]